MKLIAAVDKNWGIGKDNQLLVHLPEDMKFFRETTTGHVVIMGRKTLESFPNQAPLKNRVNIVLTKDLSYQVEGAVMVHSVEELDQVLSDYKNQEQFVIGGESIYGQLLDRCDTAYITKIHKGFSADAFFPNLDEKEDWSVVEKGEEKQKDDITYQFVTYQKEKTEEGLKKTN